MAPRSFENMPDYPFSRLMRVSWAIPILNEFFDCLEQRVFALLSELITMANLPYYSITQFPCRIS
jgi:hypothetical protein